MPIQTLRIRPPRIGRVRLGRKAVAANGSTKPVASPYFIVGPDDAHTPTVAAKAFLAAYGEQSLDSIEIALFSDTLEDCYDESLRNYTQNGPDRLCDGVTARVWNRDTHRYQEVACLCNDPESLGGRPACRPNTILYFEMPAVDVLGCWTIQTHSIHSMENLRRILYAVNSLTGGHIGYVPFTLRLVPRRGALGGMVYVLQIEPRIRRRSKLAEWGRLSLDERRRRLYTGDMGDFLDEGEEAPMIASDVQVVDDPHDIAEDDAALAAAIAGGPPWEQGDEGEFPAEPVLEDPPAAPARPPEGEALSPAPAPAQAPKEAAAPSATGSAPAQAAPPPAKEHQRPEGSQARRPAQGGARSARPAQAPARAGTPAAPAASPPQPEEHAKAPEASQRAGAAGQQEPDSGIPPEQAQEIEQLYALAVEVGVRKERLHMIRALQRAAGHSGKPEDVQRVITKLQEEIEAGSRSA